MKHDVTVSATVRVRVVGVEADNHRAAMEKVDKGLDLYRLIRRGGQACGGLTIESIESDEITGFLVDEEGDETYERSQDYTADYEPTR